MSVSPITKTYLFFQLTNKSQRKNSREQQMTAFLQQYKHKTQNSDAVSSVSLPLSPVVNNAAGSTSTLSLSPLSSPSEASGQMQKEIEDLKRQLKEAQERNDQDPMTLVLNRLDSFEDRFKKIEERLTTVKDLATDVKKLEDTFSKCIPFNSFQVVQSWLENMPERPDQDCEMSMD